MEAYKLKGIEPQSVFAYFEKLCSIPHGSGNTKAISDYLVSFAKEQGIAYMQDELNNVILFQKGTAGYEDHPPVILQGHMDMVCEKEPDCCLDMQTDGLDVTFDGDYVYANGTTLGGDDGIAVAFALALLADGSIPHPPLEVLITVDEETGMYGAAGVDLSMLKGRRMINLDSEEEGVFTVGCAGGVQGCIRIPVTRRAVYGPCIELTVEGLRGGHSGTEIHKNRANAHKVMGEFLSRVQMLMPLCLTSFSGGTKDNAIPRACRVKLVAMGIGLERINQVAETLQQEIRDKYDEPDAVVRGDDVDALGGNALTTEDTAKFIAVLNAAPDGLQAWSADIPDLVQTSLNLGVIRVGEKVEMRFSVRSSIEQEKTDLEKKLRELAEFYGGSYESAGDYPAWEYRKESPLRDVMVETYRQMTGKDPKVAAIHAGLECGLLSRKLPGLDCVAIGPDILEIHTTRERLSISSTERTWKFLLAVLSKL